MITVQWIVKSLVIAFTVGFVAVGIYNAYLKWKKDTEAEKWQK